jgi:hypothetical protein
MEAGSVRIPVTLDAFLGLSGMQANLGLSMSMQTHVVKSRTLARHIMLHGCQ